MSDKPRKCQMYADKKDVGDGVLVCEGAVFEAHQHDVNYALVGEFELATLDSVFSSAMEVLAGRVEVIKIDVEGFEPQIFAGGRAFMSRVRPRYIMAEVNNYNGAASPETVQSILHMYNDLGYAVHTSKFNGPNLLPKDYSSLAKSMFGPGTVINIYMDRLQPCSQS
ncbi:hypothetical protein COHA_000334 [Chlorella ohadii]|uniref:Methyltransferase FkbM domain-containing protein n=1 Tax=Chlorella ohadii TaxID=2649997 RepID=A0AAD5E350_9CHLO|nr:hypothetical protein COHA_000334 [Chlorella ohadii]